MRRLDRALTTPHRVGIFEGGQTWLSPDRAIEALKWMELQAMKSGLRPHDRALVDLAYEATKSKSWRNCSSWSAA